MADLDSLDRKLLYALDCDSRESYAGLARKLRVPQETVRYRLSRLIQEEIIFRSLAVIDAGKLGNTYYKILLKLHNVNEDKVQHLIGSLIENDAVNWVARMDGLYDVGLTIRIRQIVELSDFLDELKRSYRNYLHRLSFAVNIEVDFLARDYLLGRSKRREQIAKYTAPTKELEVDLLDQGILRILSSDTRTPASAIARQVQVSTETVLQRIKRLKEKGIIAKYIIALSPERSGILNYYVLLYLNNVSEDRLEAFRQYCLAHPNMVYLIKALGEWDYELNIEVEGVVEYRAMMMELNRLFSDIIRDSYTLSISELHKFTLAP